MTENENAPSGRGMLPRADAVGDDFGKVRRPRDPFEKILEPIPKFDPRPVPRVIDPPLGDQDNTAQADADDAAKHALNEQAGAVVTKAMEAITDNIDTLIKRAERLKQSIITDTAEVKGRITANLNHGAKILDLSKRMNSELDELENLHRKIIKG